MSASNPHPLGDSEIPIIDVGPLDSPEAGARIRQLVMAIHANTLDPARPYDGQPWTDQGERGRTEVKGLTMRDICDCYVIGWLLAAGRDIAGATYNDIYHARVEGVDPLAAQQNMMCEVERRMGIFPNIPKQSR